MTAFEHNIHTFAAQLGRTGLRPMHLGALRGTRPDAVVVFGMGGSGLVGELLRGLADELALRIPAIVWKNYGLPVLPVGVRRPLYLFVSFSGDTEETLSGFRQVLRARSSQRKARIAVVTTGGELGALAAARRVPMVTFHAHDLTPRQATGRMLYACTEVLHAAGILRARPPEFTGLRPERFRKEGERIARKLRGRLPVIYTNNAWGFLGYLWKTNLNETAKVLAIANVLPEAAHNEVVGFERTKTKPLVLFLRDLKETPQLNQKFAATRSALRRNGVPVLELPLRGRTKLEKLWRSVLLSQWTAYALAALNRVDPSETKIINTIKKLLR